MIFGLKTKKHREKDSQLNFSYDGIKSPSSAPLKPHMKVSLCKEIHERSDKFVLEISGSQPHSTE